MGLRPRDERAFVVLAFLRTNKSEVSRCRCGQPKNGTSKTYVYPLLRVRTIRTKNKERRVVRNFGCGTSPE